MAALGVAAFGWQAQKPELPAPFATPSSTNFPKVIPKPEAAQIKLPQGFSAEVWADGFEVPRFMMRGPSGEILLTDAFKDGKVYVLSADGKQKKVLISGLFRPYGLAINKGYLYVGEPAGVKRYKYDSKAQTVGEAEQIVKLEAKDIDKGHWTRSLLFDPKGEKFYLGVGSQSNVDAGEPEIRAAILRFNPDGSGRELFAAGTRNPIGLHWYPGTSTLFAAVQERDGLGDDLVPDYLTSIKQGGFYGWPYAYFGPNEDPRRKGEKPDLVSKTIVPDVNLGSHVAVLDFTFYQGKMFPAKYRGGAFLALHGSWNRSKRIGYSVAYVPFKNGKPAGAPEEFLTGFMLAPDSKEVWGRPVAVLELPDGSLLISDDGGKKIWRITYKG
jgi:glucose/arabinose dehydrogenase